MNVNQLKSTTSQHESQNNISMKWDNAIGLIIASSHWIKFAPSEDQE